MKRLLCLAAALLLAAMMTIPAFAETTVPETEVALEGITPRVGSPLDEEPLADLETALPEEPATEAPTTQAITLISATLEQPLFPEAETAAAISPVTYAALGTSLLALLLAVIALAKSGKRSNLNATGNYKKYF